VNINPCCGSPQNLLAKTSAIHDKYDTALFPARRWMKRAVLTTSPDETGLALSLQCCRLLREGYAQVSFLGAVFYFIQSDASSRPERYCAIARPEGARPNNSEW